MSVLYRSAFELADEIRAGKLSAVEVLEFFLARVEQHNPTLNVVVQLDADRARTRARAADEAAARGENWGPLHGVPMTIKDAYATEGIVTTDGMPEYKGFVPDHDADCVARLKGAGAVILGKTNVPYNSADLQSYNEIYGTSNNPWNIERTCGGSSGGAAAAVAAGLTPLEFGSDIGGSIRTPASFNGIYGHKPSFGIVSQRGHLPYEDALSEGDLWVPGPLAHCAGDLRRAFDLVLGPPADRAVGWKVALPPPRTEEVRKLRVATWFRDPACDTDDEVVAQLEKVAASLERAGATVKRDVKPEVDFLANHMVYLQLLTAAMNLGAPAEEKERIERIARESGDNELAGATSISLEQWSWLHEQRLQLQAIWTRFFQDFDVLLAPMPHVPAFRHDHNEDWGQRFIEVNGTPQPYLNLLFWSGFSLNSYLPATVAPAGRTAGNLPVGVQIVGPYLEDYTPLAVAAMLEQCHRGFEPPPGYA